MYAEIFVGIINTPHCRLGMANISTTAGSGAGLNAGRLTCVKISSNYLPMFAGIV